jgi:hypothetical protein
MTVGAWCTIDDLPDQCRESEAITNATMLEAIGFASYVLYSFTGSRWPGEQTDTYRPLRLCGCSEPFSWARDYAYSWYPRDDDWPPTYLDRYAREHWPCGCGCFGVRTIQLPGFPAQAITGITQDGVVLDPDDYELRDNRWVVALRRVDGTIISFRCCQRMDLATTEVGTLEVEYTYGALPDAAGVKACAILAAELAYGWTDNCGIECRLPPRVTSMTRQGVTMAIVDPLNMFAEGRTGIPDVDLWIAAANRESTHGGAVLGVPRPPLATRRIAPPPPVT